MGFRLKKSVKASDVAKKFNLEYVGEDLEIINISSLSDVSEKSLTFSVKTLVPKFSRCVVVGSDVSSESNTVIISKNPRLDFARIVNWIESSVGFEESQKQTFVHETAKIGMNVYLGKGVQIGANTVIGHNVVIEEGVTIGANCKVGSCTVIGEVGFGFEKDEVGTPLRFPHLGSVVIEDDVEIGALTTIVKGALGNTILRKNVKVDDHVHIAHNCDIGENSFIIACAEVSGGVTVGKNVWVGPSVSIIQKLKINDNSLVGIGSVVLKDVEANTTVVGVPAKPLRPKE